MEDLYFEVEYKVNGKTYSVLLSPDESDDNPDNLSIEVLFDDIYSSVEELKPGMHRVKCCIPEISNEYRYAGELEVLSYTELFESPSSVGETVSFDKTKTFRGMNYVGFNIPKTGSYKISFLSDNNYEGDYKFVAADINGCYTINSFKHDESIWASSLFGCRALHGFCARIIEYYCKCYNFRRLENIVSGMLKVG